MPYRRLGVVAGLSVLAGCVPASRQPIPVAAAPIVVQTVTPARMPPVEVEARPQPSADLLNVVQALGSGFDGQGGDQRP